MAENRTFPFVRPAPSTDSVSAAYRTGTAQDMSSLRCLVIDSVVDMRSATCAMLSGFGVGSVEYSGRSGDALGMMRRTEYDVILSEYDLGHGFDGLYLFEEARRHGILKPSCVFIIVTAERRATRVISAAELAPDAIVLKPFTGDMLYSKLNTAIRRKARFRTIDEAILAHDYLRAIKLCEEGVQAGGEDIAAFLRMKVHLQLRIGDWSAARDLCRELLAQADLPWANMALGKALFHLNGNAEARTVFQNVIAEHELVMEAYDWLARTQKADGDTDAALQTLKTASARSPYVLTRQRDLGEVAWRAGDLATAEAAIGETVRLARYSFWRDAADLGRLAEIQLARGDNAGARKTAAEVRKEFKEAPATVLADAIDADVWFKLGDKHKARDALNLALSGMQALTEPPPAAIGISLASACVTQQRFDASEQIVRTVLKNRHDDLDLQARVNEVYRKAGREDVAERLIEETAQSIVAMNNEAVMLAKRGELAQAVECFIKAVADMPTNTLVLVNAINAILAYVNKNGWHDTYMRRAEEYIARVQEIQPDNGRALQLAEIYRRTSRRYGIG